MKTIIEIERRSSREAAPYTACFVYEFEDPAETVATALTKLNEREGLVDMEGKAQSFIRWEHSCLQKRCGACAMVINGRPALACGTSLRDAGEHIRLTPLKKFPVVADLVVDRSVLYENLAQLKAWLNAEARLTDKETDTAYEASRCLQCGCCLEVCPNFYIGGSFAGMAAAVPVTRVLTELSPKERRELADAYVKRVYEGCGKSLACRAVCPAGIDIEGMLVRSNAIAVWKRLLGR